MKKNVLSRFSIFLRGMAMGIADIIPGVSGGTIAIITGIYEEFLSTLNKIDFMIFRLLFKGKFQKIWKNYNLSFLLSLLLGIFTSILIFSHYITFLIKNHPIALWAFFFGLIFSSIFFLLKQIKNWNFKNSKFAFTTKISLLVFGFLTAIYVQMLNPGKSEIDHVYLFICGMISITAMLLPGISGAYILILLGAYETMLDTLKEVIKLNTDYFLNFFSFIIGAIISIKLFSKFLTWGYNKHKDNTLSCLIGFMIGSLPVLWPWKTESISKDFFLSNLYLPSLDSTNSTFIEGIIFILLGIAVVLILEYLSKKNAKQK